jgi:hypothetical protein
MCNTCAAIFQRFGPFVAHSVTAKYCSHIALKTFDGLWPLIELPTTETGWLNAAPLGANRYRSSHDWRQGSDGGTDLAAWNLHREYKTEASHSAAKRKHKRNFKKISPEIYQFVVAGKALIQASFLLGWIYTLKWRWYVPPKRRFTYGLHGTISKKGQHSKLRL